LEQEGIERWRRESLVLDVRNALCRYAQIPDRESAKLQLQRFLDAAKILEETFTPVGSHRYAQFYHSIAQTVPRGIYNEQPDVLRALEDLPRALELVCRSARERLPSLSPTHRPRDPKRAFIRELIEAWTLGTGKKPNISGEATWEEPMTLFAKFVKVAICILPSTSEFENGFIELLRRALKGVSKPTE